VVAGSFNPFAEGVSNTSGTNPTKLVGSKVADKDKYNPNYVQDLIEQEKKNKRIIMERDIPDREIAVYGATFSGSKLREHMMEEDKKYAQEEDKWEESVMSKGVLKFIGENAKNQKF